MPSPQRPPAPSRRAVLLGAAAALTAPALAGCGRGSATGTRASRRDLGYLVIGDQDWMSRTAADLAAFAATGPGFRVTPRYLDGTQYDDDASQQVFAADPPALMWHTVSRARFADLVVAGAATDLTDYWARALPEADSTVTGWYTFGGRRYAVPLDVVLYPVICYDALAFRRLGIVPPSASTRSWHEAEFLEACAALRSAGLDPLAVAGLDLAHQVVEAIAATLLSPQELGHYLVDAWKPGSPYRYTDDAWVSVFAKLRSWALRNVFQPRAAWIDQLAAQRSFAGGVAGMVAGGSRIVGNLHGLSAVAGSQLEIDWMLFPTIQQPGRLLSFPGDGVLVPAATDQREQAEQLMTFMLRQDRMLAAAATYGHIPPMRLPGLMGALPDQVASMLEFHGRMGATCPNWPTELEAPFARACRAVLAGTRTPAEAGQDMEDAAGLARAAVTP